jgi:hypothetical protein
MPSPTRHGVLVATGLLLTACALGLPSACRAGGLRCSIGEVIIENLRIGQDHSLEELANLPLSITNTGDQEITVRVDPLIPEADDLRYGAAPIPDISWTSAERDSFDLAPQTTEQVNLRIRIPDDAQYLGKKYQVTFWSHTIPRPDVFVACGLSSRVIFTIDPVRENAGSKLPTGTSVSMSPSEATLRDVTAGVAHPLAATLDHPLVLKNPSSEAVLVELQMLHPEETAAGLPDGFGDLLKVSRVEFSPQQVELQPGEQKIVSGTVTFAPGARFPESTLVGIVSARVIGQGVRSGIYARIYAPAP